VQFYNPANKKSSAKIDLPQFRTFFGKIADWGNTEPDIEEQASRQSAPKDIAGAILVDKIFSDIFDTDNDGFVDFPAIVKGLTKLTHASTGDLMHLFFSLHDSDHNDNLTKEETLQLSESLLFVTRRNESDNYLTAISGFVNFAISIFEKTQSESGGLPFKDFIDLIQSDEALTLFFTQFLPKSICLINNKSMVVQKVIPKEPSNIQKNTKWTEKLKFKKSTSLLKADLEKSSDSIHEDFKSSQENMEILDHGKFCNFINL
jgi:hypothetical protein